MQKLCSVSSIQVPLGLSKSHSERNPAGSVVTQLPKVLSSFSGQNSAWDRWLPYSPAAGQGRKLNGMSGNEGCRCGFLPFHRGGGILSPRHGVQELPRGTLRAVPSRGLALCSGTEGSTANARAANTVGCAADPLGPNPVNGSMSVLHEFPGCFTQPPDLSN